MDDDHLVHAVRYVSLNPVRAGLVKRAVDWPWSSVHAHLSGDDDLVTVKPVLDRIPDFDALLESAEDEEQTRRLHKAETIGRPLGGEAWLDEIEARLGRPVRAAKRGPRKHIKGKLSP